MGKMNLDPIKKDQLLKAMHNRNATVADITNLVLGQMRSAIEADDWEAQNTLLGMIRDVADVAVTEDVLNHLLVMPGHGLHQEAAMEIQRLGRPSSVPYIRKLLESEFEILEYTGSEHEVIAKWFSHALARIGTSEAISVIREFASSSNEGIAKEMKYRLGKIDPNVFR